MILSFWLQQWAIFSAAAVLFIVHEIYESTERISMIYNRGRVFGICSKTESLYRVPGLDYRTKFGANSFPRTFLVLNCRASVNISILRPHIYHCTLRHCCVREKKNLSPDQLIPSRYTELSNMLMCCQKLEGKNPIHMHFLIFFFNKIFKDKLGSINQLKNSLII